MKTTDVANADVRRTTYSAAATLIPLTIPERKDEDNDECEL